MYSVYILKSIKNGKSYVGMTDKIPEIRLSEHNMGSNIWTRQNDPFELKYFETYICQADTLRREIFFKSGVGKRLKKLILENF